MPDISITGGTQVTSENESDFADVAKAIPDGKGDRRANVTFETAEEAKDYLRQIRTWAAANGYKVVNKSSKTEALHVAWRFRAIPAETADNAETIA